MAARVDPRALIQINGDYLISSDVTLEAFRRSPRTALVCGNDQMAVGALLALPSLKSKSPADVSIVGFDDQPDLADQVRPPLTTVALPHYEMGYLARDLLVTVSANPRREIIVPCPCPAATPVMGRPLSGSLRTIAVIHTNLSPTALRAARWR